MGHIQHCLLAKATEDRRLGQRRFSSNQERADLPKLWSSWRNRRGYIQG